MTDSETIANTLGRIRHIVGEENFITDDEELRYLSQDYFRETDPVTAAIRPVTVKALAEAVRTATQAGFAIFPRGGGYSYSDAYLPTAWPALSIDMRGLDKILEINESDMYATVEAGCTWAQLDEALTPLGLRLPCLGPQSGLRASIGGGVAQGAAGHGSARAGISTESVLGMEVVLADGTVLVTGSAAQAQHSAFFRFYGPDTTGLFCQDAGALGVKATVTLRLETRHPLTSGLSFACENFEQSSAVMARVARSGLASENFGTPSMLVAETIRSRGFGDNLKTLGAVGKSGAGYLDGVFRMFKLATGGKDLGSEYEETIHFGLDAANSHIMKGQMDAIREIVGQSGVEIPNSIPIARRAEPFPDHPMLSPIGQRQLPFHAIFPFSQIIPFRHALDSLIARSEEDLKRHDMRALGIYACMSTNGFLYEPVFQWVDVPSAFHRRHTPAATLERADKNTPNPAARDFAQGMKEQVVDIMYAHGGVHLQIGKTYPYLAGRDPQQMNLLVELKKSLDPGGLMNPGALGLGIGEK